jgi:hypothetical protein
MRDVPGAFIVMLARPPGEAVPIAASALLAHEPLGNGILAHARVSSHRSSQYNEMLPFAHGRRARRSSRVCFGGSFTPQAKAGRLACRASAGGRCTRRCSCRAGMGR